MMHTHNWQYTAPSESLCPTGERSFWLWEGHPKQFAEPAAVTAENASAWALKSGELQQHAGMRHAVPSQPDVQHQQQLAEYWSQQDDRILSPYMPGYQFQETRPHTSPAVSIEHETGRQEDACEAKHNMILPEEFEDDYLLMESLDLPVSTLPRSNSAHDLGETIDPEQLPDIETLQESFEIPAQLRLDIPQPANPQNSDPPSQAPYAHQSHSPNPQRQHQLPCTDQYDRSLMRGRNDQYAAVAQPVSGATTPSRPGSTASEDSVPPGCHYTHTNLPQQPHGALLHDGQRSSLGDSARLLQSKSLPLLDDFDGLTELQQQAADMMAHGGDGNLWYPMQHDEVVAQDTAAALQGLDLTTTVDPSQGMPRAMSSDLDCAQAQDFDDWQAYDAAEQTGVDTMSTADVLAELACLSPQNKRKGKGGRQPAMDPRLDPNVDPKKAKRILANRLSAARSKMKQKSHVETLRRRIDVLSKQKSNIKASLSTAKSGCESKAEDNDSLRSQIKLLEEQCQRQSMMTARLVKERSAVLGVPVPYEHMGPAAHNERTSDTMYAPYPNQKTSLESRPRALPPPSSRSAKVKDSQSWSSARLGSTAKKSQEQLSRIGAAAGDPGQSEGLCDQAGGQSMQPPLKTWGSTGKRQPGRPRHKA